MWDSRPRLSGLLTAEGGCPTFKKKHSLNCSTYFFAIPKRRAELFEFDLPEALLSSDD